MDVDGLGSSGVDGSVQTLFGVELLLEDELLDRRVLGGVRIGLGFGSWIPAHVENISAGPAPPTR